MHFHALSSVTSGNQWRSKDVPFLHLPNTHKLSSSMADFIDRLLSKRTRSRKSSSDSSTTSNISPELKKQKGNEHAVGSEDKNLVAEEDDEILLALTMSEDLHKTLHDILKKLENLMP